MRYLTVFCISLFILLGTTLITKGQDTLELVATGSKSVPSVSTNGTAMLTVIKTEDSLTVKGTFEELESYYTGGYIQMAEKNKTGNVLYRLSASDLNRRHTSGRFKAGDNTFHIPESVEQYYRKSMLYINIATNSNSGGEIRAQIELP